MIKPGFKVEYLVPQSFAPSTYGRSGVTYRVFNLHNPPYKMVYSMDGVGFSGKELSTVRIPYQHGNSIIGMKLSPRVIKLGFKQVFRCKKDYDEARNFLFDTFRENRWETDFPYLNTLRFKWLEDGVYITRNIDVYFSGGLDLDRPRKNEWNEFSFDETIEFTAPYPLFYDPEEITTASLTWGTSTLPLYEPFVFGAKESSTTIVYSGTWESFPKILLTGPVSNISLIHETSGARINFEGTVVTGDKVLIETGYNARATGYYGEDFISYVSGDLSSFSLLPSPQTNVIRVYVDGVCSGLINLIYKTWYRGI